MGEKELSLKLLLLGNKAVGKSSFIIRYCDDRFEKNLLSTSGIDLRNKKIRKNNKDINLKIYDTAGQERFRAICKNYFKSADGILLLYAIDDLDTFKAIKEWIQSIEEYVDLEEIGLIVVGNKCDVPEDKKQVNNLMKEELEKEIKCKILEASAKDNINVNESFEMLLDKIYEVRSRETFNDNLRNTQMLKNPTKSDKKRPNCCLKKK